MRPRRASSSCTTDSCGGGESYPTNTPQPPTGQPCHPLKLAPPPPAVLRVEHERTTHHPDRRCPRRGGFPVLPRLDLLDRLVGAVSGNAIPIGVYLVTVAPGLGEIYALSWAHVRRLLKSPPKRLGETRKPPRGGGGRWWWGLPPRAVSHQDPVPGLNPRQPLLYNQPGGHGGEHIRPGIGVSLVYQPARFAR